MDTSPAPSTRRDPAFSKTGHPGLRFIAVVKILKAVLITGIAFGFFRSINRDLAQSVRTLTYHLRIDPENHYIRLLLEKVAKIKPHTLRAYGFITLVYALELYVEGIGLWFNQSWAEYLLVVATGFFVPEEAYACMKEFSWERLAILTINLLVLLYVAGVIWRKRMAHKRDQARRQAEAGPAGPAPRP